MIVCKNCGGFKTEEIDRKNKIVQYVCNDCASIFTVRSKAE